MNFASKKLFLALAIFGFVVTSFESKSASNESEVFASISDKYCSDPA